MSNSEINSLQAEVKQYRDSSQYWQEQWNKAEDGRKAFIAENNDLRQKLNNDRKKLERAESIGKRMMEMILKIVKPFGFHDLAKPDENIAQIHAQWEEVNRHIRELLDHCQVPQCPVCSKVCCPLDSELHLSPDGCPACGALPAAKGERDIPSMAEPRSFAIEQYPSESGLIALPTRPIGGINIFRAPGPQQ